MFIKTQKIISVLFLCFVFCFSFSPVSVFAQNTNLTSYSGWTTGGVKKYSAVVTIPTLGGFSTTQVGLATMNPGTGVPIDNDRYEALTVAAKDGKVISNTWINPSTGRPYEKERIYTNSSNSSVSYYYKPAGGSDAQNNANTVLIAHATGNTVYFPNRVDAAGNVLNYVTKNSGTSDTTDIGTEQGLLSAIDVENGREPGTTFKEIRAVDTYKQDQESLPNDEAELRRLESQLEYDNQARNNDTGDALSAEDREALEKNIAEKKAEIEQKKANITTATNASTVNTVSMADCPSSVSDVSIVKLPGCVITLLAIIANIALKLSALVLYLVGNLFDYSIEIAVNSAEFFKALNIIEPMWAVVRDFANMTFIFVLIYLAWQILLGKGNFSAKENVMRLVLVAILINFSLFAAKAMVDASNILSLNIYESIKAPNSSPDVNGRASVSARIMGTLGLASVYNFSSVFDRKTIPGCGGVPGTILTVGIFGTILFSITSITFLIAAILFFMRMLNILILFITSPVWVWGYVINESRVEKLKIQWMNKMLGVMKFPVIYMLILYVGLAMFGQLSAAQLAATSKPTSILQIICNTATGEGKTDIFQQLPIIINFVLVIAILMYAIKYAVSDGAQGSIVGGKFVSSVTDKLDGFSKKITIGAAQGLYQKAQDGAAYAGQKALAAGSFAGRTALTVASSPITGAGRAGKYLVRQGTYKAADWLSNKMGSVAANPDRSKFMQTTAAMLSNKVKEPKVFGETKKEGEKRRTSAVRDRTEALTKVQMEQTKIQTQAEWLKKNEGKTIDDYAKYTDGQILKTIQLQLGGLSGELGPGKEKGLNNVEYIRQGIVEKATVDGKEVVRVNQDKLKRNIDDVRKYHKENKSLLAAQKKTGLLFGWMTDERANAEIEARDKALKASIVGKATSIEDKNKKIEKIKKDLERLPENIKAASQESDLSNYDWRVAAFKKAGDEIEQAKLAEQVKDLREKELIKLDKLYADIESTKEKEAKKAEEKKK